MEKSSRVFLDLIIRYTILIIVAIPSLWIFYKIFTPLTVYPFYFLIKIFFNSVLLGDNIILIERIFPVELINACIAGAAYYLLFILNLSIPKIKFEKRIRMILFAFVLFLTINVFRIFILTLLALNGSSWFDMTHKLFWNLLSTLFVAGIWFIEVKIYKIKEIPLYSDLKFLYKNSKFRK